MSDERPTRSWTATRATRVYFAAFDDGHETWVIPTVWFHSTNPRHNSIDEDISERLLVLSVPEL